MATEKERKREAIRKLQDEYTRDVEKYWPPYSEKVKDHCGFVLQQLMDIFNVTDEERGLVKKHFEDLNIELLDHDEVMIHGTMGGYNFRDNIFLTPSLGPHWYQHKVEDYEKGKAEGRISEEELLSGFFQIGTYHEMGHLIRAAIKGHVGKETVHGDETAGEFLAELGNMILRKEEHPKKLFKTEQEGLEEARERMTELSDLLPQLNSIVKKVEKGKGLEESEKELIEQKVNPPTKGTQSILFSKSHQDIDWNDKTSLLSVVKRVHKEHDDENDRLRQWSNRISFQRFLNFHEPNEGVHTTGFNLVYRIHNAGLKDEFLTENPDIIRMDQPEILQTAKGFIERKIPKRKPGK